MYIINKIVGGLISPLGIALAILALAFVFSKSRKTAFFLLLLSFVWIWTWSTPVLTRAIGISIEREYWSPDAEKGGMPVPRVESFPKCDAIVLLGGGMGFNKAVSPYAEIFSGADRVWQAARAWKAGKAPVVIPSGMGCADSDARLLLDLGVPRAAIHLEDASRNTEENARYSEQAVNSCVPAKVPAAPHRVLLVTSAWHMKRSELMFEKYAPALEIVPCATDFEATVRFFKRGWKISDFFPDATSLWINSVLFHEILGYWGYRFLR